MHWVRGIVNNPSPIANLKRWGRDLHADLRLEREENVMREHVGECHAPTRTLERGCSELQRADRTSGARAYVRWQSRISASGTHNHFVNKDTQSPPIHGRGVPCAVDHFRGDIFCVSKWASAVEFFFPFIEAIDAMMAVVW
jgi:hypothetical protein